VSQSTDCSHAHANHVVFPGVPTGSEAMRDASHILLNTKKKKNHYSH
jgi:hypothetical protein